MSQEIIYTSAPRGLKLGSKGFCTVASTRNMVKPLADRLESLSGYRHVFTPGDPQNPVNYSHVTFTIARQQYHVLSRIADAGYDYSQRSNKLAHHVVLTPDELPPQGPAWLLSQPGFMETEWNDDPHYLDAERTMPAGNLSAAVCKTWHDVSGDAGWAGVLAQSVMGNSKEEVLLIYKQGTTLLDLICEAQSILPADQRWTSTFSTYFTKLQPNTECRWRCVMDSTDTAEASRRLRHVCVIDLTKELGAAPASPAVEAARTGQAIARRLEQETPVQPLLEVIVDDAESFGAERGVLERNENKPPPLAGDARLEKSSAPPPRTSRSKFGGTSQGTSMSSRGTTGRRMRLIIATSLSTLAATAALILTLFWGFGYRVAFQTESSKDDSASATTPGPESGPATRSRSLEGEKTSGDVDVGQNQRVEKDDEQPDTQADNTNSDAKQTDQSGDSEVQQPENGNDDNKGDENASPPSSSGPDLPAEEATISAPSPDDPGDTPVRSADQHQDSGPDQSRDKKDLLARLPESIDIKPIPLETGSTKLPTQVIGQVPTNEKLVVRLVHQEFTTERSDDDEWTISRPRLSDPVASLSVSDGKLYFHLLSVNRLVCRELKKGAIAVRCGEESKYILLSTEDPTEYELELRRIDSASRPEKITPSAMPSEDVRILVARTGFGHVVRFDEVPKKEVRIPVEHNGKTLMDVKVQCVTDGDECELTVGLYEGNELVNTERREEIYTALNRTRAGIQGLTEKLNSPNKPRPLTPFEQNQIKENIKSLKEEQKNIMPYYALAERVKNNPIKIYVKLCYYDEEHDIRIPLIEK